MEKRLFVQLNGNRKVIGVLRGYDVRVFPSRSARFINKKQWSEWLAKNTRAGLHEHCPRRGS